MAAPKLMDQVVQLMRVRHYALRTEKSYCYWIRAYIRFHLYRHPKEMTGPEVEAFLSHLASSKNVAPATQTVALNALVFLYREVLKTPLPEDLSYLRPKYRRRLPVVFTVAEVQAILQQVGPDYHLMASLLYGSGLRLMECLRWRERS